MGSLKDFAIAHNSKKELTDLKEIPIGIDVKEGTFPGKDGLPVKYNYVEIDGYKYSLNSKNLNAIKSILHVRPQCTKVQFVKTDQGMMCIPLD